MSFRIQTDTSSDLISANNVQSQLQNNPTPNPFLPDLKTSSFIPSNSADTTTISGLVATESTADAF